MLSPDAKRQLKELLTLHKRGIFGDNEFRIRFAHLVTEENAVDILDAIPAKAIPWFKDAVFSAAQTAVDAEYLRPESTPFEENPIIPSYHLYVAEVLLKRFEDHRFPNITVICLPSFEVEWAIRVFGSPTIGFTSIYTEPEEMISCHPARHTISVLTKHRTLPSDLGETLDSVWKNVLSHTRYAKRGCLGLDGTSYHFAYHGSEVGRLAGQTWSPSKHTVPGKLVALSYALRSFLISTDEDAPKELSGVAERVAELKSPR